MVVARRKEVLVASKAEVAKVEVVKVGALEVAGDFLAKTWLSRALNVD